MYIEFFSNHYTKSIIELTTKQKKIILTKRFIKSQNQYHYHLIELDNNNNISLIISTFNVKPMINFVLKFVEKNKNVKAETFN